MTTLASRSLEQALLALFKTDETLIAQLGGTRLYDEPKRDCPFPYITLATSYSRDWSTGTEKGDEHRVIITLWTGANDRERHQEICARLRSILEAAELSLTDHTLVNLQIERLDIRSDRKAHLLQGVMQVRAVTEESTG
ncbi:DUF3168 domain-containing protein [uncultured Cohaesibacter sp.]|uniref:DUF3168 domain-containing protein n=1 Tax=uncultured Cohaesibacter sp. TaxID=1002546 RepID=UPI00292F3872|nr:DUF3168 domain-containing protein [uncultured Cohaesibacter sp.]